MFFRLNLAAWAKFLMRLSTTYKQESGHPRRSGPGLYGSLVIQ